MLFFDVVVRSQNSFVRKIDGQVLLAIQIKRNDEIDTTIDDLRRILPVARIIVVSRICWYAKSNQHIFAGRDLWDQLLLYLFFRILSQACRLGPVVVRCT